MPPSIRSNRVSAPPDRVYESVSPLAQVQFPPRRQRVYGRTSLGAPLSKKRQNTLTQIGFVNPERIDAEIEEYEREEREEKKRKVETLATRSRLRAKPVIGKRDPMSGARLRETMDDREEDGSAVLEQEEKAQDVPVQRLDYPPEPSIGEERPKRRRKSRRGIKIGVKIVTIKVESPEVQRHATQHVQRHDQLEIREEDVHMVMDSFQAAPSFEEEKGYAHPLQIEAQQEEEAERRRNRVIPDSDAESEDDEIIYDSNDDRYVAQEMVADSHEDLEGPKLEPVARADSEQDLDEVRQSIDDKADSEQDLDELKEAEEDDEQILDLNREIPDSQAESEDDDDFDLNVIHDSQQAPVGKATHILNSFFPASPTAEPQPPIILDSFYFQPPAAQQHPISEPTPRGPSPIFDAEIDFVPGSSAAFIPDITDIPDMPNIPDVPEDVATMPPTKTPTKPRRTEIPNTNSTCSPLSTQSTIRLATPSSARSKIYNRSPSKIYNRSPLKRLSENNILHGPSLSFPELAGLSQSPSKRKLRESQVSTQGTPTQRSKISQLSSFIKHEPEDNDEGPEYGDEVTVIPDSPTVERIRTPITGRNDSQYTVDTNSPSKQINSELSAALGPDRDLQPSSSGRTIGAMKTEIKDSQSYSEDDDDMEEEVLAPSSPKPITPRIVRFQSIPLDIQPCSSPLAPRSSPATGSLHSQSQVSSKPSLVGAETQMRSQWLGSDGLSSGHGGEETQGTMGTIGESQWLGDLLPESLMLGEMDELSVPPILDDDSVWDEFESKKRSTQD